MEKEKLKELAEKIGVLETECQKGKNVKENSKEMEKLVSGLSIGDIFQLTLLLEKKFKNF